MLFSLLSCLFFLLMILFYVFIFKKPTGSILPNMLLSLCISDLVPFLIKLDCKTFPSGCISLGFLLSHPLLSFFPPILPLVTCFPFSSCPSIFLPFQPFLLSVLLSPTQPICLYLSIRGTLDHQLGEVFFFF